MNKINTRFKSLLYVYEEMSESEKQDFKTRILLDEQLEKEVFVLSEVKNNIEKCMPLVSPGKNVLDSLKSKLSL